MQSPAAYSGGTGLPKADFVLLPTMQRRCRKNAFGTVVTRGTSAAVRHSKLNDSNQSDADNDCWIRDRAENQVEELRSSRRPVTVSGPNRPFTRFR